jgi:hypothetical protein
MLHDFELAGKRVKLWQRLGESYDHVLMKALGYTMFACAFPSLEIERKVNLRFKSDLIACDEQDGLFPEVNAEQTAFKRPHGS